MPQDVIARVHTLVRRAAANITLTFADRFGDVISDDDDNYAPGANADDDDNNDDADYPFDEYNDTPNNPDYIAGVEGYYPPNANPDVNLEPKPEPIADAAEREPHNKIVEIVAPVDEPIADPIDEDVTEAKDNEIIVEEVPEIIIEEAPEGEDVEVAMNELYGTHRCIQSATPKTQRLWSYPCNARTHCDDTDEHEKRNQEIW